MTKHLDIHHRPGRADRVAFARHDFGAACSVQSRQADAVENATTQTFRTPLEFLKPQTRVASGNAYKHCSDGATGCEALFGLAN